MSDLPTPVGPNRMMTGGELSGFRSILDLLCQNLLEGRGDDLSLVLFELVVPRKIDLNAALHCGAGQLVYISLETRQEI